MFKNFRTYLLRGMLIILPAGATFLIFYKLFELLDNLVLRHINSLFKTMGIPSSTIMDLLAFLIIISLIGFFGGNFLGKNLITFANFLINKVPYISVVYATLQQILESVFKEKKNAFSKVALVEYPRKGIYSLGFITADTKGQLSQAIGTETYSVFMPTTPNPTSGVLIFVPKSEAKILDLSIDQAAKLVMSAGVIDEKTTEIKKEKVRIQKIPGIFKGFKNDTE